MYQAPLKDIQYALATIGESEGLAGCARYADYSPEVAASVLEEAGRLAQSVLDPLYASADREPAQWSEAGVRTSAGFVAAYAQYVAGGWPQLRADADYGGQGLPTTLVCAVDEIFSAANVAFRLCALLTQGAIEAIAQCGSAEQKATFLPPMVRGAWTGTMNLTEPQAGSDLGLLRTRAVADGDHYRIFGQKIFITYGEHDLAENIIHLVLARIDGAPPGVKGISLFIVPKFLVRADGTLGERNDVHCASIEHKLGIRGSPTCTMVYGQRDGAIGYLLGEAHHGLEYMFIMMNAARLGVGVEGYAVAVRAYQRALDWARQRIQGRPPGPATGPALPIAHHADVRRMLLTMKAQIEAMRYLGLYAALQLDRAAHHADAAVRTTAKARGDLLIPIVKGWSTETGFELCSLGVQVHGGMGFIEDTGAAQTLRDARISSIYEGTTGIQATDLIGRKLFRDQGQALLALVGEIVAELAPQPAEDAELAAIAGAARAAAQRLEATARALIATMARDAALGGAVAVPFLKLAGITLGGWLTARAARRARRADAGLDAGFAAAKLQTAGFYAGQILPQTLALAAIVEEGASCVLAADADLL